MLVQDIASLNRFYSRPNKIFFEEGPNGFPLAKIRTKWSRATIAMYGGQLVSFKPVSCEQDLFYLSEKAIYQQGKAIRGGVPLCWPWFGDDPDAMGRQAHGFARNLFWEVLDTRIQNDVVTITLGMDSSVTTKQWWPHDFKLRKTLTIGESLSISLTTENCGGVTMPLSEALHSYFLVGDISQVAVSGLDKVDYLDKTRGFAEFRQQGDIRVDAECDRVFLETANHVWINDASLNRQIEIEHQGAGNFVVWNPWDKAADLADMPDQDYQQFICVETANALANSVLIEPGNTHTMSVSYTINPLG